ncbi:MAG: PAS domain S-box protein [Desulfovibrionaceae bacterium]
MNTRDNRKTKAQLIAELEELRTRLAHDKGAPANGAPSTGTAEPDLIDWSAYDAAPIGVFLSTPDGRYLYANPALARMYGYASPAALREHVTNIADQLFALPANRAELWELLHAQGEVSNFETRIRRQDDSIFWTSRTVRLVRDADGTPTHCVGFVSDITSRKEAENKYRIFFEKSALGIMHASLDGKLTDANPALATILGYDSPEEMIALIHDITTQIYVTHGEHARVISLSAHDADIISQEATFSRKNGSLVDVEYHVRVVRGTPDNGYKDYIEGFVQDITTRKRTQMALQEAQEELGRRVEERTRALRKSNITLRREIHERIIADQKLRESEQKFRSITASAKDAIIMIDHEGKTQLWNKAAEGIFGYTAQEIIGKNLHEYLMPAEATPRFTKGFGMFTRTGRGPAIGKLLELTGVRKDGTTVPVEISISPVRFLDKWSAIGIMRDISQRKEAEDALRRAKEEAEAASRLKSDFLSVVSHELRTPLTSVVGFAKIIQKRLHSTIIPLIPEDAAKPQRAIGQITENISVMIAEGERLTALINDVLDLAKLEANKIEWKMEACSLPALVDHSMAATAALFREKGLARDVQVESDLPDVVCDRNRIVQVLINLIANAVKFTAKGHVSCRLRRLKGAILISVSDTGIGIPLKDQTAIFDKFRQVGDTLTDRPKGTGLGLSICQQIVEYHGGSLSVESEPGKGSTFTFSLPIPEEDSHGVMYRC